MSFNLAQVNEVIAAAIPEREALVFRDRRFTFAQLDKRANRLANFLLSRGVRTPAPRSKLPNWVSGQDHVALYMYNGNEYLEATLAAMKARAIPYNVNFRYVAEELLYLFKNASTDAIVYHSRFAPLFATLIPELPPLKALIQVDDGSGIPLLPGAVDYEAALAMSSPSRPEVRLSPDDLFMMYTGGTTGMPKGVLWKHSDILDCALGGRYNDGRKLVRLEEYAERARDCRGFRYLPAPPFMHGTGQWVALGAWHRGNTIVIQDDVEHLDPHGILRTIEDESINVLSVVGDAFGRPILQAMQEGTRDASSLTYIINSGAALSVSIKEQLLKLVPGLRIVDTIGASETGPQALNVSTAGSSATTGRFRPNPGSVVISEDRTKLLDPGHEGAGWFAGCGNVPLGYLNDEAKTRSTFPVIDGVRYSVPGDRVKLLANGEIEFLGRESFTINSGGEKIFVEEVEQALLAHPDVDDAVVSARPSERWGSEVVAIVQLAPRQQPSEHDLLAECGKHIARYKLPKAFVFVDRIQRAPNGKADYAWARGMAEASA
jgi:acyl-CoA synthetase (AMP-forming)/AMP-acid ligase II